MLPTRRGDTFRAGTASVSGSGDSATLSRRLGPAINQKRTRPVARACSGGCASVLQLLQICAPHRYNRLSSHGSSNREDGCHDARGRGQRRAQRDRKRRPAHACPRARLRRRRGGLPARCNRDALPLGRPRGPLGLQERGVGRQEGHPGRHPRGLSAVRTGRGRPRRGRGPDGAARLRADGDVGRRGDGRDGDRRVPRRFNTRGFRRDARQVALRVFATVRGRPRRTLALLRAEDRQRRPRTVRAAVFVAHVLTRGRFETRHGPRLRKCEIRRQARGGRVEIGRRGHAGHHVPRRDGPRLPGRVARAPAPHRPARRLPRRRVRGGPRRRRRHRG
mmetsp:Transcript_25266/g.77910  ORF Transcript_25266/g.77910 Transcript_25266/m.77910 type:complete len:334 (+) Transcript_25266:606-1607(+)